MTVAETLPSQFMRKAEIPEIPDILLSAFESIHGEPVESIPEMPAASVLRSAAWKAFSHLGLPHSGSEEYSFLSVRELQGFLSLNPESNDGGFQTPEKNNAVEYFDLTADKIPAPLLSAWTDAVAGENDAAAALATALSFQPEVLRLKAGSKPAEPFAIICRAKGPRTDAALFVDLETNSSMKISLRSEAPAESFLNTSLIFRLGENAELDLIQEDFSPGAQTLKLHFLLGRNAKLRLLSASTGSRFQRLALEVDLLEPGAEVDIRGAAVIGGSNRCHRHVLVRHRSPDCLSRQLFKTVALGSGRSSVDGTVVVDHGAQRTDARQVIHHLMLSKDCRADAKPRLLIHADDVKCSHGAAVGRLNPEQLFYLRSRGLDAEAANRLLTHAFLAEAVDACALTDLREAARARLLAVLEKAA